MGHHWQGFVVQLPTSYAKRRSHPKRLHDMSAAAASAATGAATASTTEGATVAAIASIAVNNLNGKCNSGCYRHTAKEGASEERNCKFEPKLNR